MAVIILRFLLADHFLRRRVEHVHQAPSPDNVLGKFKFNFLNKDAIYMHDTIQPEFFGEPVTPFDALVASPFARLIPA